MSSRADVEREVEGILEGARLTGDTRAVNELVHTAFGSAGAVDMVAGWGTPDGYTTAQVRHNLQTFRDEKLAEDAAARERAKQADTADAAVDELREAINQNGNGTGDLHSEGAGDGQSLGLGQKATDASAGGSTSSGDTGGGGDTNASQPSGGPQGPQTPPVLKPTPRDTTNDGPGRESTADAAGVHHPILEGAALAVPDPAGQDPSKGADKAAESRREQGPAGTGAQGSSDAPRYRMDRTEYDQMVRATATKLGISRQAMRQLGSTARIEAEVRSRIEQRLGQAAFTGSNSVIVTLRTGDDEIRVERPGLVVDVRGLEAVLAQNAGSKNRAELLAQEIVNTLRRSGQGIYAEGVGGGAVNLQQAEGAARGGPVVLAQVRPPRVRAAQRAAAERARHEREVNRLTHPANQRPHTRPVRPLRMRAENRQHQRRMREIARDRAFAAGRASRVEGARRAAGPPRPLADEYRGYTIRDFRVAHALTARHHPIQQVIRRLRGQHREEQRLLRAATWAGHARPGLPPQLRGMVRRGRRPTRR
jgi:hypothetical protein